MGQVTGYTSAARYKCLEDLQQDSVELCLCYCGWEQCEPGHRFGPNRRRTYVLHFVGGGYGTFEINNRKYRIEKGDAFFIPPGVEAWYESDQEEPWFYSWLGFCGVKAKACMDNAGFSLTQPVRRLSCLSHIQELIKNILEEHQLTYKCELRRNACLMEIMAELVEEYMKDAPGTVRMYPGTLYVRHAIDYINSHYSEKIRISDIAMHIGVNRSYLTSSFKKATGYSPQEYLILLRMEKAAELLKKTDLSVNDVAASVGYGDQLAFSKIFKQYYGASPKAFRESKEQLVLCVHKGEFPRTGIF